MLNTIESALEDLKIGKMLIVVDDEDRENEGDLLMVGELATPEAINFMSHQGKGLICTPLSIELAKKFELNPMVGKNTSSHETAFTVSIDATHGISTGISAADRSLTIKLLSSYKTIAADFVRPGHIFPLIAKSGGVLEREGHTEAAVDLAKMSGFSPVGVICEIINEDGSMARMTDLLKMAKKFNLKIISIRDLIEYRLKHEKILQLQWSRGNSFLFIDQFNGDELFVRVDGQKNTEAQVHFSAHSPSEEQMNRNEDLQGNYRLEIYLHTSEKLIDRLQEKRRPHTFLKSQARTKQILDFFEIKTIHQHNFPFEWNRF